MWIDIKGFEGKYQVNELGMVKSLRRHVENGSAKGMCLQERILKQQKTPKGYYIVSLRDGRKTYAKYVHILVAESFLEHDENKPVVNHKDGNKGNNTLPNLEYVTYSDNNQHAYNNGLHPKKKHRLSEEEVLEIRNECQYFTRRSVAQRHNVAKTVVDAIATNKTWKHLKSDNPQIIQS